MKGTSAIREIFSGTVGELSSKRFMTFLSFTVMMVIAYVSIFMGKEVQQFIFDGFLYIVIGGLFSVASEKFSQRFVKKEKYTSYVEADEGYGDDEFDDEPDGEQYRSNVSRWEDDNY